MRETMTQVKNLHHLGIYLGAHQEFVEAVEEQFGFNHFPRKEHGTLLTEVTTALKDSSKNLLYQRLLVGLIEANYGLAVLSKLDSSPSLRTIRYLTEVYLDIAPCGNFDLQKAYHSLDLAKKRGDNHWKTLMDLLTELYPEQTATFQQN